MKAEPRNSVRRTSIAAIALTVVLGACTTPAVGQRSTPAPELGQRLVAEHGMVSSAHPLASEAGVAMLRQGGNAVDAAVATAFAVGVVEPQMSGLGGGGSMLIWLADEGRAEYLDFYAAVNTESLRGLSEDDPGRTDLRVVAIPGEVAGLLEAHERFGTLSRTQVMAPAIRLAEEGFAVNQILAQMIAMDSAKLAGYPASARFLYPDGRPLPPGARLRNPELAETLRIVAREGRAGFYRGPVARTVVSTLNEGGNPATLADLAAYEPRWKRPLCSEYQGNVVLSAAPPQTGLQVLHTLELLEPFDLARLGYPTQSAEAFDVLTSALRVGQAGNEYNSDPRWETVPAAGVISEGFARERGALVGTGAAPEEIPAAGDPMEFDGLPPTPACAPLEPYGPARRVAANVPGDSGTGGTTAAGGAGETTHISVVDAAGNAVALTQTNSSLFGSGARTAGFFLNNSAYSYTRLDGDAPASTTWRTRNSTISPTIVLEDGAVRMVVGAPGGGRIPTAIAQTMVYVLDYGLDPLEAVRMPRIFPSDDSPRVQLENGFNNQVLARVRDMGYEPAALSFGYARLYMIVREAGHWIGVADPRHNGGVRGY